MTLVLLRLHGNGRAIEDVEGMGAFDAQGGNRFPMMTRAVLRRQLHDIEVALAQLKTAIACSSVNLDRFIVRSFLRIGL